MQPANIIALDNLIYTLRGHKVMLSHDLSRVYGVETKALNQAVKRNMQRFPEDFMFQLTQEEKASLKSQIVTSKGKGGIRYLPLAFTEQGVAMLSSVLNSDEAIAANIAIIRLFVKMREMSYATEKISQKLKKLEQKAILHDEEIESLFEAITLLMKPENRKKRKIGFITD
jgi:hypothetical protein